ncbi:hypothetical protein ILUMI_22032 [Ignelater luminosus]|uniref:Gag protein n=1 Tax=Ignelater luminosus TaxID=2038154 RepID=A0A8K0G3A4_IGNLU|nr:hypothetical protein ILUMI_22032 [Ignelater luminosus]
MSLSGNNNANQPTIQAAKEIANTLRYFSGRGEHLELFIKTVDKFYDRYGRTIDNNLPKIIDEAGDFLMCRSDLNTWPEVKEALRNKLGNKLDKSILQQFIFLTKGTNENIADFLERLKLVKMRLNLKLSADPELDVLTKASLNKQNETAAVTVLITNTNAELRTPVMLKNPTWNSR